MQKEGRLFFALRFSRQKSVSRGPIPSHVQDEDEIGLLAASGTNFSHKKFMDLLFVALNALQYLVHGLRITEFKDP